jgi:FAD/FMN-containing dehydrogenase
VDLRERGAPLKLFTDAATRSCYRTDGGRLIYGLADAVACPRTAEEVAELLRTCQEAGTPVTCRGGGLTTEGESVARRGVLLDLKGLNRLLECDGRTAWVEAGMTWHRVAEALRPRGLDYVSAPLNMTSSVGGTLGVGGIDVNSPKYGCSADQALEIEVVTPTGEIRRVKSGDEYFERVILGYGQFGVITKARIPVRPYAPMATRHYLYTDIRTAIEDLMRVAAEGLADACAILTLMDRVIALIVGFEGAPRALPLRGSGDTAFALKSAVRYGLRPWRWGELPFLLRRKKALIPALQDPLFVENGRIHDRAVVFSRLIWRYWGDQRVVVPDLAMTKAKFVEAAVRGIEVCRRYFRFFTLYGVMIRKFGDRPRYEMSCIPPSTDDHVCGIEFSPLLEGATYSTDHFMGFQNAIYDIGLDLKGSYYRFGGVMKPYIRRQFGDEMVERHRRYKKEVDPAFILNPDVIFDGAHRP